MTEIKPICQQFEENEEQSNKIKINVKTALRLAQKEELELIYKIQQFHNASVAHPIEDYEQQKTLLQTYLDSPTKQRSRKLLKSIKAELSYLKCFQINPQQNAAKQLITIMKRDLDMLTAAISKFVHPKIWPKGAIVQTVATQRDKIRVLLRGSMAVFVPINYKSYKNCLKLHQNGQIQSHWNQVDSTLHKTNVIYDQQNNQNSNNFHTNPQEFEAGDWQDFTNKYKPLSIESAKAILKKANIISLSTPHRLSGHLSLEGQLICSDLNRYIIDQQAMFGHSTVCLTQCYVMELEYAVYKQAISHLNNDSQKKYIEILLQKFEMMDYFDAKEYVKKENMIDKKSQEQQLKKKQKQQNGKSIQFQKQMMINQGRIFNQKHIQSEDDEHHESTLVKSKKQKEIEKQFLTYKIPYDNDLYIIIQGEVTIQIDIIEQIRLSRTELASKVRVKKSKPILKIYQGDIFGFENIGKIKQYNLTYIVVKDSKLLLLNENTYIRHFGQIQGFKELLKQIQSKRNNTINVLIKQMEKTLEQQQLKKYKSVSLLSKNQEIKSISKTKPPKMINSNDSFLPSSLVPPRQIQFVGVKEFQKQEKKIRQSVIREKDQQNTNNSLQQFVKNRGSLKDSLSFASVFKRTIPKNASVEGEYIEIRNSQGLLVRKRSLISDHNIDRAIPQSNFLRKIGVISDQQRNNHNLKIVQGRKSKYQLPQFNQQRRQFKRLKDLASSLPKLKYMYAKKQQRLYNNMHKLNYQRYC